MSAKVSNNSIIIDFLEVLICNVANLQYIESESIKLQAKIKIGFFLTEVRMWLLFD